jgi:hypothetical protein
MESRWTAIGVSTQDTVPVEIFLLLEGRLEHADLDVRRISALLRAVSESDQRFKQTTLMKFKDVLQFGH